MTIPALRRLRRVLPHAHITLATRAWAEGLFADADFLDELLIYNRRPRDLRAVTRQVREWRRRSFDLALLFQNAFEAALIAAAARYAALADRFVEEAGASVMLIGSPDEIDVSLEVEKTMRYKPFVLTGKTDLAEVTGVLSLVDILITNDTGPAHIAAALNRPTLVIFGPTDPRTTQPFSNAAEIIRRPPDCAPCMLRDCPIDHRCMTAISAAEVFERASLMMKRNLAEAHQ